MPVAVATRGLKRICPSCGTRYYDFNKRPVLCPECKAEFTGEIKMKTRRSRAVVEDEAVLGDEGIDVKEAAANDDDVELPENDDTVSLEDVEEDEVEEDDDTAIDIEDLDDDLDDDDLDDDDDDDDEEDVEE